jgi:hypothetical protein
MAKTEKVQQGRKSKCDRLLKKELDFSISTMNCCPICFGQHRRKESDLDLVFVNLNLRTEWNKAKTFKDCLPCLPIPLNLGREKH